MPQEEALISIKAVEVSVYGRAQRELQDQEDG